MAFAPVPHESKGSINRAAQALVEEQFTDENYDLVNRWRACHAYPINTFQATLRDKLRRKFKNYIVAQRLKRFDTIIGKLRDDSRLSLTTMQDIGGVRAILRSKTDVFKLTNEYLNSSHFSAMIESHSCKDYITNPKTSGYRGVHIIFKYKNTLNPSYNGLRVEMQIRTKLQHVWATAVEVMGTFRGEKLKSGKGDEGWQRLFTLVSSYFAYKEKSAPVFPDLSERDTMKEIVLLNKSLGASEIMNGFTMAADKIHQSGSGSSYHLIVLDSAELKVDVKSYDRKSAKRAIDDYTKTESDNRKENGRKEVVLVSAGKMEQLRKAYPNYFLDTTQFVIHLLQLELDYRNPKKKG